MSVPKVSSASMPSANQLHRNALKVRHYATMFVWISTRIPTTVVNVEMYVLKTSGVSMANAYPHPALRVKSYVIMSALIRILIL
jgi:hypothetical protein